MRSFTGNIASVVVTLALVGCDGFVGVGGATDATGTDAVGPDGPNKAMGVAVIAEVDLDYRDSRLERLLPEEVRTSNVVRIE